MQTTRKEINFKGQRIYVGIDTHLNHHDSETAPQDI